MVYHPKKKGSPTKKTAKPKPKRKKSGNYGR